MPRPSIGSANNTSRDVFITGGSGYVGVPLIARLLARGHTVRALVRRASQQRIPSGASVVIGDALDASSYASNIVPADTLVHLVGTPHPSPRKVREFREVDLASIHEAVTAARRAGIRHLVYVSVAHPAPVMRAYIAARVEGEALVRDSKIHATMLRPWYVLGPGHRWPYLLQPLYALFEAIPNTRPAARRLGLVTLEQMLHALVHATEHPPDGVRIVEVPEIRAASRALSA
jgi:uncharacterized protein YbjT (DUF2867 family)